MKIKFAAWVWYGHVLAGLAIPVIILDFFGPPWWTPTDSNVAFGAFCVLVGIPSILFWTKIVKIQFVFSEKDKRKTTYKLWKFYCETFGRSITDGSKQSK